MTRQRMHDDELDLDVDVVRRLLADQAPELCALPLVVPRPWGTDHAVWFLGDELVVRLPRIGWAAGHPEREATWLPRLAPRLPVVVPTPVLLGAPGHGYPWAWSVQTRLPGVAAEDPAVDRDRLARDLAAVVRALGDVPVAGAPPPRGRGRPLADYDDETRAAIAGAADHVDVAAAVAVWEARDRFLALADVDDDTLRRSRGVALHQACAALPYYLGTHPPIVERARHQLEALGVLRP